MTVPNFVYIRANESAGETALTAARRLKDRVAEGRHLAFLGSAQKDLGLYKAAIERYEPALSIAREIGDRRLEGRVLRNRGVVHMLQHENDDAKRCYAQALQVAREIGDLTLEGNVLHNMGAIYLRLNQFSEAIESYEQALELAREANNRRLEGITLMRKSVALYRDQRRDPTQAIVCAEEALDILEQIEHPEAVGLSWRVAQWRQRPTT